MWWVSFLAWYVSFLAVGIVYCRPNHFVARATEHWRPKPQASQVKQYPPGEHAKSNRIVQIVIVYSTPSVDMHVMHPVQLSGGASPKLFELKRAKMTRAKMDFPAQRGVCSPCELNHASYKWQICRVGML